MKEIEEEITKVFFNKLDDFKFIAAYETYSRVFDNVEAIEEKQTLNELISQLDNNEISYQTFYSEINRYKENRESGYFKRARIQGQRKGEYRRDQQAKDRNSRYRR